MTSSRSKRPRRRSRRAARRRDRGAAGRRCPRRDRAPPGHPPSLRRDGARSPEPPTLVGWSSTARWSPASWRDATGRPEPDLARRAAPRARRGASSPSARRSSSPARRDGSPTTSAEVAQGRAFLLQAGDCAESFDEGSADSIRDKLKVDPADGRRRSPTRRASRSSRSGASPGSSPSPAPRRSRSVDGVELEAFRGHIVNDEAFDGRPRGAPTRERLLAAYHQSVATLNLLRAFTTGGFADARRACTPGTRSSSPTPPRASATSVIADEIERALRVHAGVRHRPRTTSAALQGVDFYTSHEALVLNYEEALTRRDSLTGDWYDCSAHLAVDRRADPPARRRARRVRSRASPTRSGCKVGPTDGRRRARCASSSGSNPDNRARTAHVDLAHGRRARRGRSSAPVVEADARRGPRRASGPATPCTATRSSWRTATRRGASTTSSAEMAAASSTCTASSGTWPGGLHVELTGDDVTECLGGGSTPRRGRPRRRTTRRSATRGSTRTQSLDLAFHVAEFLRDYALAAAARGRCSAGAGAAPCELDLGHRAVLGGRQHAARRGRRQGPSFIACSTIPPWHDDDDASRRGGAAASRVERAARSARGSRCSDSPPGADRAGRGRRPSRARRSARRTPPTGQPVEPRRGACSHRSQSATTSRSRQGRARAARRSRSARGRTEV